MDFRYPENIRFTCLKCGICCGDTKQKQRHVLLLKSEAEKISSLTKQPISEFAVEIEGKAPYVYEMRKTQKDGKCLFLEDNRCKVYSMRPIICRFYPFELRAMRNRKPEFRQTDECPGIGKDKILLEEHFQRLFSLALRSARIENRRI